MQQITYPFSASLEGEEITTDAVPEFNWSPTTWVITQHLEEDANLMRKEEVSRRGPPQTVAKKLCYRKDDSTRKPAFMRLYRQLPTIGTEYDRPTVRALQAIPNQENDELETFRRLKLLRCSVTPELLAYSEAPQGDYGPVPGGFSICIIWDKVPGDSLSLDYFWGLDRDARDAIRGKFREVFEYVPALFSMKLELTYRAGNSCLAESRQSPVGHRT